MVTQEVADWTEAVYRSENPTALGETWKRLVHCALCRMDHDPLFEAFRIASRICGFLRPLPSFISEVGSGRKRRRSWKTKMSLFRRRTQSPASLSHFFIFMCFSRMREYVERMEGSWSSILEAVQKSGWRSGSTVERIEKIIQDIQSTKTEKESKTVDPPKEVKKAKRFFI